MPKPPSAPLAPVLPARARLLHIGPPKSGTTTIQGVAARNRARLLEAGVRYPGRGPNHRIEVSALMGRQTGWGTSARHPGIARWQKLMAEIEADTERRILLSSEFGAECDDEQILRFRDELGPRMHAVVTLRPYAEMLGSGWQEFVKIGFQRTFDSWLQDVLADPSVNKMSPKFQRRSDHGELIRRWVALLGAEAVTVIVADRRRPAQLTDGFADLLGVPREVLAPDDEDRHSGNRSLTLPEAEMIRAMNRIVRPHNVTNSDDYKRLVRGGAVARLQRMRTPAPDELKIALPPWAARRADELAQRFVKEIEGSGCQVVGDLAALCEPALTRAKTPAVHFVPVDAAAEALAGTISAALGKRAFFGVENPRPSARRHVAPAVVAAATPVSRRQAFGHAYRDLAAVPTAHLLGVAFARQALTVCEFVRARVRRARRGADPRGRSSEHSRPA